jgi:major vault protein
MGYNDSYDNSGAMRQKDLVLAPNEFCFLQSKTNGVIKTHTGPIMMTISQQEALVVFDTKSKQFREVQNFDQAKQLFVSAPENWYVILKNPTENGVYPEAGKAVIGPELKVGEKVNIRGPVSFSLFPGQMAKVIRGHALRTNQYLLARVYEATAASKSTGEMRDPEGNVINTKETYVNGQILVIKGTEVSFYIPPTGIEVIPVNSDPRKGYVREAVTLERLEYCILKDEDGNKRYVHGPEVVFPKATETFVTSPNGGFIFRAIELSKISGIYAKVIAEYKDEDGTVHPVGEELFITGDDQMIYYPRPEHAIISYDNKIMHHAIAIPEGEGRYIMNRMTGEITTVKGPKMYLPDPRTEVVVKRKLTPNQCELWFPGNRDALLYNQGLSEKAVEKSMKQADTDCLFAFATSYSDTATMANLEAKANISRGTSYTKPRTITLDNKFEGVVSMDIWTGYAVNVISKDGTRKVVRGPQTILLDYDQTLEVLQMSTGKPKTTDSTIKTVYLRHENNKVSDIINIETKDFVQAEVKVSYCVDFDPEYMDKWFSVENYVKYLCDRERALIKRAAKNYTIEEFYQNYGDIVRNIAIDNTDAESSTHAGRFFAENGMYVHDCEVLSIHVEDEIAEMLEEHQHEMVRKALKAADAERRLALISALAEAEKSEQELRNQQLLNKMNLQREEAMRKLEIQSEVNRINEAEKQAAKQAELDMQVVIDAISAAELARKNAAHTAAMEQKAAENAATEAHAREMAAIDEAKSKAYAETVAKIMTAISPELVAAMESRANADVVAAIEHAVAPYAIAGENETVTDVAQRLVKGTAFEDVFKQFGNK